MPVLQNRRIVGTEDNIEKAKFALELTPPIGGLIQKGYCLLNVVYNNNFGRFFRRVHAITPTGFNDGVILV